MKYADIQSLHDAGLITDEQRRNIVEHEQLKEGGGGNIRLSIRCRNERLYAIQLAASTRTKRNKYLKE